MAENKKEKTSLLLDDYLAKYKDSFGLKEASHVSYSGIRPHCWNLD